MLGRRSRMHVLALTRACWCALAALALSLAAAMPAGATNFSAAQNADLVLGAPSFTATAFDDGTKMTYGMVSPNGVAMDGSGSMYVADTGANRLMRWSSMPAVDGAAMSNVLMKPSGSQQSWSWGCTGASQGPEQMSIAGDGAGAKVAVADRFNHRVVLYVGEPTTDGPTGSVFLGQSGGSSCSNDRGGSAGAGTLDSPSSVWTDGTRVAVADTANNRVLLWNAWPTTGQAADVVLGQATFTSTCQNRCASTARNSLDSPKGVFFDGSYLYVVDTGNDRVMIWSGWPAANGADADYLLGQSGWTNTGNACNALRMSYPTAVVASGSGATHKIAVANQNYHRVTIYTGFQASPSMQPAATDVLGQANLTSCRANRGSTAASASSLRSPNGLAIDGAGIWVADADNHRVIRFPSLASGSVATRVLGHAGATALTATVPNDGIDDNVYQPQNGASVAYLWGPVVSIAPDGSLLGADQFQSSISVWNGAPASTNEAFDLRLGQATRSDAGINGPGNTTTATTLDKPTGTWTDGTRLLVADTGNDRVLVWTTYPASDAQPPDYVLGQPNFTATSASAGTTGLDAPRGVTSDGVDVYVADTSNDRVLVYRNFWAAPANQKPADVVLGQVDWTSTSGATSLTRVNNPAGMDIDGNRLVVADHDNSRVVVWNNASTLSSFAPIDVVIGQSTATGAGSGGIAEDTGDVAAEANSVMWVEDCRAFVLDPIPASGFVTAGATQVGTGCSVATTQNGVHSPSSIDAKNGRVWIGNAQHGRLMRWTDTTAPTITAAPTASVRCDGTVTVTWTTSESTSSDVGWDTVTRASYAAYANKVPDPTITGLTHSVALSFATAGTKYVRVRSTDWNSQSVESGEISFTVPATCPAPTTMLGDDLNAQSGTGRANPSPTNAPAISSSAFHTSWLQPSGVAMDRVHAETWTTPPEHAGGVWHFDNAWTADSDGQSTGTMTPAGGATFTAGGKFGQAFQGGSARYASTPHHAALQKSNDFTVDAWVRSTDLSLVDWAGVVNKSNTGGCGAGAGCAYGLEFDRVGDRMCFMVNRASDGAHNTTCGSNAATLADGQWHHVAGTMDASNDMRLFVDGVLVSPVLPVGGTAQLVPTAPLFVGAFTGGAYWWNGEIDEVRFSPVAYDAAALQGYIRTSRPHAEELWDSTSAALGATCATATRCEDQAYAGAADIVRTGARYWQRARFNTVNNDYWSDWGVDWLETSPTTTINVSVGSSVPFGSTLPGADAFGSSTVRVTTNSASGYQLLARDESDTWGLERIGGGPTVLDRQDGAVAPAAWPAGTAGFFGVTVRDAPGGRLSKWGTGTGWPEGDVTNNRYAGLEGTSDVLLHERLTYGPAPEDIIVTWRANPGMSQAAGSYDGVMTLTAIAAP